MRHLGTMRLETQRLILRPFTREDGPHMLRNWAGDSEVTRYLTWPVHTDEAVSLRYIESLMEDYDQPETYNWGIEYKDLGEVIGSISVVRRDDTVETVHIGYCLGRSWWNRGIMPEAFAAVIRFFIEEVGANRVEARHDLRNPGSGRVMEKCGLIYEGTLRQSGRNNQGICDEAWYALLREDYLKGREA